MVATGYARPYHKGNPGLSGYSLEQRAKNIAAHTPPIGHESRCQSVAYKCLRFMSMSGLLEMWYFKKIKPMIRQCQIMEVWKTRFLAHAADVHHRSHRAVTLQKSAPKRRKHARRSYNHHQSKHPPPQGPSILQIML